MGRFAAVVPLEREYNLGDFPQLLFTHIVAPAQVSYWQILLQKSFCTGDQKFFWP
jgi:hypothetical protein